MLEVLQLSKSYGKKNVLVDVNFTVKAGEIVSLIGPNGCGKSTLLLIIANLIRSDKGEVRINQHSNQGKQVFKELSLMLDDKALNPYLSGRDHLEYSCYLHQQDYSAIKWVIHRLEIESFLDRPIYSYSMGMKQKLLFALALLPQPKVLLLDEPHNGLDPTSVGLQREVLFELANQGVAILLSSHYLSVLQQQTDKALFLKNGTVELIDLEQLQPMYQVRLQNTVQLRQLLNEIHFLPKEIKAASIELRLTEKNLIRVVKAVPEASIEQILQMQTNFETLYREKYSL